MKLSILAAALGLGLLASGSAFATEAAAPATPAATPAMKSDAMKPDAMKPDAMKSDKAAHSAKSQECSKEADAKGLHGKARKEFRSKCKKGE